MDDSCECIGISTMLIGSLSLQHGAFSGCRWKRWPPDMEGTCKYYHKKPQCYEMLHRVQGQVVVNTATNLQHP